ELDSVRERIPIYDEKRLLEAQAHRCAACGSTLTQDPRNFALDHRYPYAVRPENLRQNFQALCIPCNSGKSDAVNFAGLAAWRIPSADLKSPSRRRSLWVRVRYAVLERDRFRCRR